MVDFVADSVDFVAGFGDKSAKTWSWQLVTVDIVVHVVDFVGDTVDFVADTVDSVYGAKATKSTFNKVNRVEFMLNSTWWLFTSSFLLT